MIGTRLPDNVSAIARPEGELPASRRTVSPGVRWHCSEPSSWTTHATAAPEPLGEAAVVRLRAEAS